MKNFKKAPALMLVLLLGSLIFNSCGWIAHEIEDSMFPHSNGDDYVWCDCWCDGVLTSEWMSSEECDHIGIDCDDCDC